MEFSRRDLLAFGGAGLVGAAASSAFSHMQVIEPKEWIVGDHGGITGRKKTLVMRLIKPSKPKVAGLGELLFHMLMAYCWWAKRVY
ncbi:hypothetical protein [Atlantibacter subterraneus]|uniref:hypothetical protein n=1 Tax=Atlantibacter subterraneus TaxID=255519 RepID=UPI002898FFC7|nr:hypothetical protein [Atlantibacter subterranea]